MWGMCACTMKGGVPPFRPAHRTRSVVRFPARFSDGRCPWEAVLLGGACTVCGAASLLQEEVQLSISACGKGRQPDQALEFPADMQQICLVPDMIARMAAISAFEKAKQPHKAVELLAEMQLRGLEPTRRGAP